MIWSKSEYEFEIWRKVLQCLSNTINEVCQNIFTKAKLCLIYENDNVIVYFDILKLFDKSNKCFWRISLQCFWFIQENIFRDINVKKFQKVENIRAFFQNRWDNIFHYKIRVICEFILMTAEMSTNYLYWFIWNSFQMLANH